MNSWNVRERVFFVALAPAALAALALAGYVLVMPEMLAIALSLAIFALALGALLAHRLARDLAEPAAAIQDALKRLGDGHLDARVTPHAGRTLQGLETGVNAMAASLQAGHARLEDRVAAAADELKQKKEEAEHANTTKSRFLAAASHDLRQPLHALALFAADLEHGASTDTQRRLAGQISTAVGSLGEMLDALLDISRIDIGARAPSLVPLALDPLLQRVVAAHSHSARAKGLTLRRVPTRAWAASDPGLIERMIGNFVSNAVRYTWRGGIVLGVRREGDNLRIEVWDSGIGIPPEHQRLIFQEFFQVANPERDPGKGLGLGLALVDRLAKMLSHPVHLRSLPGRGSVFGLTLPRAAPVAAAEAGRSQDVGSFAARVLVLNASTAACESLCRLLASWGCQVTCAQTGAQAAMQLTAPPDLIICEDNRCREAVPFARAMAASGAAPALIMVGDIPAEAEEGMAGVRKMRLAKPLQPAKLRALMRHLLEEARATRAPARAIT